jgi:uncharacterized membrane protein YgdD (TMEM256/DUF423 family)
MHRKILIWGLLFSILAVVLGAFGAHALKAFVSQDKLQIFETGVRYQFMHALALIGLSLYGSLQTANQKVPIGIGWSAHFFIVGVFLFSGSLYALTFLSLTTYSWARLLGPITPLGGLCFIMGWVFWLRAVYRDKVDK